MSTPSNSHVPLWRRPALRALIIQALLLAGVVALIAMMVTNALNNLEARGITTGFAFLNERAGFSIPQSLIDYSGDSS